MRQLVLLLLAVHLAYAGKHSHTVIYTATKGLPDFPEFVAATMVDGMQVNYFDSEIKEVIPRQEWVRGAVDEQFWQRNTQIRSNTHQLFKNNINIAMERFNQTQGVHTVQVMYGCELYDDGTKRGYYQYGYDGEDFLSLDKKTLTWTAANPQAVITKVKWDSTGAAANARNNYLDNTCIEWLKKYVDYGKDTLERKVSPQVSLLQKSSSSPVVCHATGFYPREIKISWQKNGQDHDEDVELGELIPNADGTFQRTSTLNVKPEEWKKDKFSCVVEHQDKTISSILTEDDIRTNNPSAPTGIIIGIVVAAVLLVVIAIAGFVVYRKKNGFKPVSGSDDGSNSSTHTVPKA